MPAPGAPTGFDAAVLAFALALVRLFYREIAISGAPPTDGPIVLVANHPNGLLDPAVMRAASGRPIAFLAKSTLFANPVGARLMRACGAIPVYRAKEADTARNEATFARCYSLLGAGGWLALFPEGISHDEPGLQPLKTGAARIALQARVPGLRIVPVGIFYEDKEVFRTRVALAFGAPIPVEPAAAGGPDGAHPDEPSPEVVRALTTRIADALGDVLLQAEDREVWRGLVAVAAWTSPDGGRDMAALDVRARRLADVYRALSARDPDRVARVVEATRHFVRVLQSVGVADPLALEAAPVSPVRTVLPLVLLAPIALVGAVLGWVPYRLVRPVARRLAGGHADVVGTFKLLLGTAVLATTWIAEAIVAGAYLGPLVGLGTAVVGPLAGFVALRWGERFDLRREALRAGRIAGARPSVANAITTLRRALAAEVERALQGVEAPLEARVEPPAPAR